jgi:AcrR family transcriptional regulator
MSGERQLTAQGLERKQQLLDHAARLFAERGYADTRIVDICRAAGVAKGLFYWYFENKEQLFTELAAGIRQELRRTQADAMGLASDPLARLHLGTAASVRFMAEHGSFFSLLEAENVRQEFSDVLRVGTEVHVADVAALIQEAIDAGEVLDDDPALLARGVVGIVGVYAQLHRSGRATGSIDGLADFVARFVVRSLSSSCTAPAGCITVEQKAH